MKKSIIILLVIAISLAMVGVVSAAAPAPGGPFNTAFYVQNLEAQQAQCSYVFYKADGTAAYTSPSFNIDGGKNYEVYTGGGSFPAAAGQYAAVVSCNKKAAAMANFSDANSSGSYGGVSAPSTVWYAPAVYNNYYSYYSNMYVQNATGSPINITVDFYDSTGAKVATATGNAVPAYSHFVFDQSAQSELLTNKVYSAKITATGNVAPVVNIYGGALDSSSAPVQLYSYNPFAEGALKFYAPIIYHNYYGFNTDLSVQNIGTADANVTITYSDGTVNEVVLKPNSGKSYYTPGVLPENKTKFYSAVVTSDQPVVVIVNESSAGGTAATYNGLAAASQTVSIPLVMKNYYGFNTDITCQNMGTAAADITITYSGPVTGATTRTAVAAGSTAGFYTPGDANFSGVTSMTSPASATVTSAQPIACEVNESGSGSGDSLYAFNGFLP